MKIQISRFLRPFLATLLVVGIAILALGARVALLNRNSDHWLPVDGLIESQGSSEISGSSSSITAARFKYSYNYQQKTYHSSRLRYGLVSSDGRYSGLRVGDVIKVYVNSNDPSQAVIETGVRVGDIVLCVLGLFVVGFTTLTLVAIRNTDLSRVSDMDLSEPHKPTKAR